jgi:hypothetical protein
MTKLYLTWNEAVERNPGLPGLDLALSVATDVKNAG